jgi:hypothetical protein
MTGGLGSAKHPSPLLLHAAEAILIHPSAWKEYSQKFALAVLRWHYGFADTATLREERSR